ncbi:DUF4179 domain-containing protein [Lederbergia citrea]|uniref:DUF4179 domain-containing protein n=1 Tax=Lederbergia citrea TaxID=2833581 RepID=UPI001BC90ED5|nr:DUF4179 domain-containing protein [Lederbergia citrea]MBS4178710.1 DUF4179 domain-containing protein [Lederbergia citrea]
MKCPTVDELSQYVDDLVTGQESVHIDNHLKSCDKCKRVVEAFMGEQQFIKETLLTPTLPEDFASSVLEQLEPYEQKSASRKKTPWRRAMLSAAGILLAVGLSATFNPTFAQWIGGLFSTDQVDEGLRMATEAGFAKRVNQEVTDKGITFKVEDVVADSSRIAVSYQVLNENGKIKNSYFDLADGKNEILAKDNRGKLLELSSTGWSSAKDYGFIELSIREQEDLENIIVKFDLNELNSKEGHWQLEIPIDLKESLKATKTVRLKDANTSQHGVDVHLKEVRFAPSSNELLYETSFTQEEQSRINEDIQNLENQYGKEIVNTFTNYGTAIAYHIENENMKVVSHHNSKGSSIDSGLLQGTGQPTGKMGEVKWNESFIPQKKDKKLSFVLDGIIKTEPADFSVTFKPNELKKNLASFEYEGNFVTIKEAKKKGKYSLRKSLLPVKKEDIFTIEMEGEQETLATELGAWVLVDDKGMPYLTYLSGATYDEKDENGRNKTSFTIRAYDVDEIPEELTLHLLSVTRYYEVKDKWKVPLY